MIQKVWPEEMKKNQPASAAHSTPTVRLYDIGPKIEFFTGRRPSPWPAIQRALPTATILLVTTSLVFYLTVGSGAASAPQPLKAGVSPASAGREVIPFESQAPDLADSAAISRGLSIQDLLTEKTGAPPAGTAAAPDTAASAATVSLTEESAVTDHAAVAETLAEPAATPAPSPSPAPTPTPTPAPTPTPTPTPTPALVPAGGMSKDQAESVIELAHSLIGVPYVRGGTSTAGLDCSGFTLYIYSKLFGIDLPHKASEQVRIGTAVRKQDSRTGDILCFDWDHDGICDHVGLSVGGSHYVNASRSRGEVCELVADFASDPILTVRRIIN